MPEDVRELLHDAAAEPTATLDFEQLWSVGRRQRHRLQLAAGGAVAAILALAVVAVPGLLGGAWNRIEVSDQPDRARPPHAPRAGWSEIAESPLRPRSHAHAFWTGREVLVIGGSVAPPCGPAASCVVPEGSARSDAAAYDPVADTWRLTAPSPVPLGVGTAVDGVVIDGVLYLWVARSLGPTSEAPDNQFFAYSLRDDLWEDLPLPPTDPGFRERVVAAAGRIVVYRGSAEEPAEEGTPLVAVEQPDLVFDTESRTWSELPRDPLFPSYDRTLVWTGQQLVLLAPTMEEQRAPNAPALYRAAALNLDSGQWVVLPDSEVVGWDSSWFWAGGRLVNASTGSSSGGRTSEWGRSYPHGGILDPATATWSALPSTPGDVRGYEVPAVGGTDVVLSSTGWAFHVSTGTWAPLDRPDGAPDEAMAIVWAGDRLVLWGGARWDDAQLVSAGWTWVPPFDASSGAAVR